MQPSKVEKEIMEEESHKVSLSKVMGLREITETEVRTNEYEASLTRKS